MANVPSVRASDSDREQVAERLRHATVEGRLSPDELEDRLGALYSSRTYGELDALVADLPATSSPAPVRHSAPLWIGAAGAATLMLATLGALAGAVRHSAVGFYHARHPGEFAFPGPVAEPHHLAITAGSAVALFFILAICATFLWVAMRTSRRV